ncbi:methylmalonyl-CoA mutase subunit beta [Neobacillus jeddahensis]|uniref:methylmalonyl-CoA mutase subunit beta n=1 Tax=Neobacillus jeddahensis TaxID=1461580 RepID=UPI00058BC505|nr:methylmalonyl-CoA mutase subunit beta [Neobacillus jeddahensis]
MDTVKKQSFPPKTKTDWTTIAERSLKSKTIDSLNRSTYENIILKPLYSREDEQAVPDYSGGSDFRRGTYPLGYITNDWKVAQRLTYQTSDELKIKLLDALEKGQSAISFEIAEDLLETNEDLSSILGDVIYQFPLAINARDWFAPFLAALDKRVETNDLADKIKGYLGADLIALFAETGQVSEPLISDWQKKIIQTNKKYPNLRTILIDTVPFHNGGANSVQELGIAIAEGVFYLEKLQDEGMEVDQILAKIVFQFSVGSNFFMEIAKFRAARILWHRVTRLYDAKEDARGMIISAETSSFTKTVYDPHVNLLRAGNEAFAAILGGVQYLHVEPFDGLTGASPFSERIARNTQLLLKEEAMLTKVIDPAGGSWYVEQLTNQLAEKAWEFFQHIEAEGGILEGLKSNWLQQEIEMIFEKKKMDGQTRKQSIIGTNIYANLDEIVLNKGLTEEKPNFAGKIDSVIKIKAIPKRRLAESFEELRSKADHLEKKIGISPAVGMICLGELTQYKARLDFMKGFLAAGGLKTIESKPILTIENARQFMKETLSKYVCLCGTNQQYEELGYDILLILQAEYPERIFYLAGLPDQEKQSKWKNNGIRQFIHVNINCYETLSTILRDLEASTIEETKA